MLTASQEISIQSPHGRQDGLQSLETCRLLERDATQRHCQKAVYSSIRQLRKVSPSTTSVTTCKPPFLQSETNATFVSRGDAAPLSRFCLAPLTRDFKTRIAARGPLKMDWKLLAFKHASIVSHRAQPLGEDQPDTAYRQVVVRIASRQKLTLSGGYTGEGNASKAQLPSRLRWVPEHVRRREEHRGTKKGDGFVDNGKVQEVVEYLVLQNRLIRGEEEGWKVQGFAQESTPARMQEDEEYWNKTLSAQAAEMT